MDLYKHKTSGELVSFEDNITSYYCLDDVIVSFHKVTIGKNKELIIGKELLFLNVEDFHEEFDEYE
jgi:hypothetical protein